MAVAVAVRVAIFDCDFRFAGIPFVPLRTYASAVFAGPSIGTTARTVLQVVFSVAGCFASFSRKAQVALAFSSNAHSVKAAGILASWVEILANERWVWTFDVARHSYGGSRHNLSFVAAGGPFRILAAFKFDFAR